MISSKLVYIKLVDIIEKTEVLYEILKKQVIMKIWNFIIYNEFDMFDTGEGLMFVYQIGYFVLLWIKTVL